MSKHDSDHHDSKHRAVNPLAGSPKGFVKVPGPSLDTGGGDDPHDGRAHSGFTGDNGTYQSTSSTGVPASLQTGPGADLGAQTLPRDANNDAADRTTNYERRDARIDSSRITDKSDGSDEHHEADAVTGQEDSGNVSVESPDEAPGIHRGSVSNMEQPSGDGNYRKGADRTVSNDDDVASERD